ncbi:hypothetical protein BLI708_09880 [Bifidobacterium imperatoris]|uniref:C4-dicarboxylate ABC transporter n=1 Tax=Bifidobacterium imperatoris TaxID=2020965 RepID=A0A2N5IRZ4_9BIFI|nr:hypothetical protein [Bifidobacterium imperatoris]PLS24734.1 hypothetical protein Tam1G_1322 [Bifidobacterium imperatoris]QSY57514.1 hypothetical protein BLI708_09880 [Bifidobacterium imperatoris]
MTMFVELLPALLWIIAAVLAFNIICMTIMRGHIFTPRSKRPPVYPVSWNMVMLHVVSFIMAIVPFPVYALTAGYMDTDVRDFYEMNALAAAIIIIVLVMLEILVMYLQAHNAMETEMDRQLGLAIHKNGDMAK